MKQFALILIALLFLSCSSKEERIEKSKSLYQSGYELMINGQNDDAERTFKKAVRLDKENAQAWNDLGSCLIEQRKYDEAANASLKAAKYYENAFLYDDKTAFRDDAQLQAGEAYLWNGNREKALAQFQTVYKDNIENKAVILNIAATCIRCGAPELLSSFAETNIREHGKNISALVPLYLLYAYGEYSQEKTENAFNALLVAREHALRSGNGEYDEDIEGFLEKVRDELRADAN